MMIEDYSIEAVHTFQVRTLQSLGFRTRVTLSNRSHERPEFATDYRVDVTAYGPDRSPVLERGDIARLAIDQRATVDCTEFVGNLQVDAVVIFRLIPLRLLPQAVDGRIAIAKEELFHLLTVQDHYVEYYRPSDGFSSGVLYQSGSTNYAKFSKEASTLIQAPKVYVSKTVDTVISLMNSSPDRSHTKAATVRCVLAQPDRRDPLVSWTETIRPFEPASISVKKLLEEKSAPIALRDWPQFLCFYAIGDTAAVVPLTIVRHEASGAIGIEHSLPPAYYAPCVTGPGRARVVESLSRAPLFASLQVPS